MSENKENLESTQKNETVPEIKDDSSEIKIKTSRLSDMSPIKIVRILLIILTVLFVAGIWLRNRPDPVPSADSSAGTIDEDVQPEETVEPTPLPNELIDPASITVFIDKTHSLPADYVPESLVTPYINSTSDVIQVNEKAADALKSMAAAASDSGVTLYLTAGYISYETQDDYFNDRAGMVGEAEANKTIAKAGFSEHQTGLAFDFSDEPSGTNTTVAFADTDAGKWLIEHAWEYGFIMRYPEGKEAVTGYTYQPWHYRYIGKDVAKAIHEAGENYTLEEYYKIK